MPWQDDCEGAGAGLASWSSEADQETSETRLAPSWGTLLGSSEWRLMMMMMIMMMMMMCAGVRRVLDNYRRHQAAEDRTDEMDGDLRKAAQDTQGAKDSPAKQMGRELGKSN